MTTEPFTEATASTPAPASQTAPWATLHVLADSGHHFQFVPFPKGSRNRPANLEKLCREDKSPWLEGRDEAGKRLPWLRYRYTSRAASLSEDRECGVLVAIETNLGRPQRGWIYQPEEPLPREPAASHKPAEDRSSPYAYASESELPADGVQNLTLDTGEALRSIPEPTTADPIPLEIVWQRPLAGVMDVDLVIDFGNTRTAALLVEHNQAGKGSLNSICYPVRFAARGADFKPFAGNDDPAAIVDSWFILQEPQFAGLEPGDDKSNHKGMNLMESLRWETVQEGRWPFRRTAQKATGRTLQVPQLFAEISPALLGTEAANVLTQLPLDLGGNFFLSSPKRYLWDQDLLGQMDISGITHWTMNLNRWHPNFDQYSKRHIIYELGGTLLRFIDEDGRDWSLDDGVPPNERADVTARPAAYPKAPAYPRSEALTWTALAIIEMAYRQMTSAAWREQLGTAFVPRRLKTILVTFPPGWTGQELAAYRRKWQKAVDIFTLTHLPDRRPVEQGGSRPELLMDIDEAVASQLPMVFGEIQRFGAGGGNWIELVGRGRATAARVRILNIDIGGGTTDTAIIDYQNEWPGPGVQLKAELLYRDSTAIAGDALVRRIIEAVLLPALGESLMEAEQRNRFETLLSSQKQGQRRTWNKITRLVFIPVVRWWLQGLANETASGAHTAPAQMTGSDGPMVDANTLDAFNSLCRAAGLGNLLPYDSPLNFDPAALAHCVTENFSETFRSLAKVLEAFDCDLVLVSGKPSELPAVKELLQDCLPILPQRILFAHKAEVGDWYPLSLDGLIHDAKTVTVAGAALYRAIRTGLVPGWTIERTVSARLLTRNYWGIMPRGARSEFSQLLLASEQDENVLELMVPARIGRRRLPADLRPEPVYELRWRDRKRKDNAIVKVALRRVLPKTAGDPESLEIDTRDAQGRREDNPPSQALELRLCTLDTEDYWIDAGRFDVLWPEANGEGK